MRPAAVIVAAIFLVIYLPDVGHGFISDDFRWIVEGRIQSPADVPRVLTANVGFYRPVVALSFAADYALWGGNARGYGITNLMLCLVVAWALYALVRQMRLPASAGLVAAATWLFNFHAVNMAVLWLSGRTSLLVSIFALAAANAVLRRRAVLGAALCLLAMLSKEEAVVLPAFFTAAHFLDRDRAGAGQLLPLWAALAVYLPLRAFSGAFWPADAPAFYQFSSSLPLLLRNVAEYIDRVGTAGAIVAVVLIGATRVRRAELTDDEARVFRFGALWIPAMFVLTVALPVRSSLYALLPSIGTALAVAAVASGAARVSPLRFQRAAIALLVVAALLVPVYRSRNDRWVQQAELSESVLRTIAGDTAGRPAGHVVLVDAPEARFNLVGTFGNLLPEALRLRVGEGWTGELVGALEEATRPADLAYRLSDGVLVAIPAAR